MLPLLVRFDANSSFDLANAESEEQQAAVADMRLAAVLTTASIIDEFCASFDSKLSAL